MGEALEYKDKKFYGRSKTGNRKLQKRLLVGLALAALLFWTLYKYLQEELFPRELILTYATESKSVVRRYVLFTTPIQTGEWPSFYSTKDRLISTLPESSKSVVTQVFSSLPRRVSQIETLSTNNFVVAMATDSTHIMADDFYPKTYLAGTATTLLLVLGPLDPLETQTVQDHLSAFAITSFVIKVPADDLQVRKFELLGSLAEFRKYDAGKAKYYTIIDHDVHIPSLSAFQNLLSQYNNVESHLIVDDAFKRPSSTYTPITLTATLLDRMFDGDTIWDKCSVASASLTSGAEKISKCVALTQGIPDPIAKFDGESLVLREVNGSAMGLLEAGQQPLTYRPIYMHGQPQRDLWTAVISGQGGINTSELFGRYVFWEDDAIKWVYTHGCSLVHYMHGISEKELRMTEVTWHRAPDEVAAHDAPYYRALVAPEQKTQYLLHSIKPNSAPSWENGRRKVLEWVSIIYRSTKGEEEDVQIDWVTSS